MIYTKEVENMCKVAKGVDHGQLQFLKKGNGYKLKR